MDTNSKAKSKKSTMASNPQSGCGEPQSIASADAKVDLFVVHEQSAVQTARSPASAHQVNVSLERAQPAEYNQYGILLENRIAHVASRVAHELNNPLATILLYAQLLLSRGNLDEIARDGLEIIFREAEQAALVTTSLFFFALREKPEKQLISIQDVLQRTMELHVPDLMAKDIGLVVKIQPDIPGIMADPHQMRQLFNNIIKNAEQSMLESHGGGTLQVEARQEDEFVKITFRDDGTGIPQKDLKRIFEPFFTTRSTGQGLGLGLSICSSIVEAHGGNIYALSDEGRGATIVIELPISA
jgi:signal transduction histidine kinase